MRAAGPDPTLAWYERNAAAFAADTAGVDLGHLYAPFLGRVPGGGRVLDAGCGSGRDAAAFAARGYRVVATEPCEALARRAEALLGAPVLRLRFEEMRFAAEFDGVWACASLLHVPRRDLPGAVAACLRALRPGGVLFASFKHGRGERERDGRRFTDLDEAGWAEVVAGVAEAGAPRCGPRRTPGRAGPRSGGSTCCSTARAC